MGGTVHSDSCNLCLTAKVFTFGKKNCDDACKGGCRRMEEKPRQSTLAQRRKLGMTHRCSAAPFKNECCANGTVHSDNCNLCLTAQVFTFGKKDCDASCKGGCRRLSKPTRRMTSAQRRKLGMTHRCSAAPFKNECCANGTVHSDN